MGTTALLTQSKLLNDLSLQQRVAMAVLRISNDVINEDPNAPNHANRYALAQAAMRDPASWGRSMYNYIVVQPGINEHGADSSQIADQTILDAVSAMWDSWAAQMTSPAPMMMMPPPPPPPPLPLPTE
jgi:hypothetical protein